MGHSLKMTNRRTFTVVRRRLLLLFILSVAAVLAVVFALNYQQAKYIDNSNDLGAVINQSGRQRMLSQWLTKEFLLGLSDTLDVDREKIDSVSTLFSNSHNFLKSKSEMLDNQELDQLFQSIQVYHGQIISVVALAGSHDPHHLEYLLHAESRFLPLMDAITYQFQLEGSKLLDRIDQHVANSKYLIALSIFLSAGIVMYFILSTIGAYARRLEQVGDRLRESFEREQNKVAKLQFLTDTIKVGVWEKDFKESTEKWSARLYDILGYSRDDYKGTAEEFMSLVHPADQGKLTRASDDSVKSGISSSVELRVRNAQGDYIWVEASGNARRNDQGSVELLVGAVLEITDRKMLEMQLKVFIERAPAAIAMFNTQMRYIAASNQWQEDYHIQDQEIIGRSHYDVFPEIGDDWKHKHQRCLKGHVDINHDQPFEREDGSIQYLDWEVRPWYLSEDQIGGIIMFTRDVTQSLHEKEELRKAKQEADRAAKAKEDFLATMSHEIRTPLNAIIGISHILQMENPRPDQEEHIKLLRFSGENLLSLINDILDISKINSGKIELSFGRFDLKYLIENIRNSLAYKAKEKMVNLVVNYDENLPNTFIGDVTRIAQVMNNLVGNAIKFTSNGEVVISVELMDQSVKMAKIRLGVKDDGIGIAPEKQDKIFNSFEQAEDGTTRRFGGTGLGLFITKKLIELMGSEIRLESTPGVGSTFSVELDLPYDNGERTEVRYDTKHMDVERMGLHLLVAEDNAANQLIVMKFLNKVNITYDVVSDGTEALNLIQSKEYDMVFMDLQMPVMDGFEATRAIRKLPDQYFQNVPIVALTADAFMDIKKQTQTIGMSDYMSKPFKPANFYEVIRRNVGQVKPKKPSLQLGEIVKVKADGDESYRKKLLGQSINSYLEFYRNFNLLLVQPNYKNLSHELAEIRGLNQGFKLGKLQKLMDDLGNQGDAYVQNQGLVSRILLQTKEVIEELKRLQSN